MEEESMEEEEEEGEDQSHRGKGETWWVVAPTETFTIYQILMKWQETYYTLTISWLHLKPDMAHS